MKKALLLIPMALSMVSCETADIALAIDEFNSSQQLAISCDISGYTEPAPIRLESTKSISLYSKTASVDPAPAPIPSSSDPSEISGAISKDGTVGNCKVNKVVVAPPAGSRMASTISYKLSYSPNKVGSATTDTCELNDGQVATIDYSNPRSPGCAVQAPPYVCPPYARCAAPQTTQLQIQPRQELEQKSLLQPAPVQTQQKSISQPAPEPVMESSKSRSFSPAPVARSKG